MLKKLVAFALCLSALMLVFQIHSRADDRRGWPILCILQYGPGGDQTYVFDSTYSTQGELDAMKAMCDVAIGDPGCQVEGGVDNYGEFACCETCNPLPDR